MASEKLRTTYEAEILVWRGQETRFDKITNLRPANSIRISSILIGVLNMHEAFSVRH